MKNHILGIPFFDRFNSDENGFPRNMNPIIKKFILTHHITLDFSDVNFGYTKRTLVFFSIPDNDYNSFMVLLKLHQFQKLN